MNDTFLNFQRFEDVLVETKIEKQFEARPYSRRGLSLEREKKE